jgi:cytoskeletal protein CcmA (bactofilin family)
MAIFGGSETKTPPHAATGRGAPTGGAGLSIIGIGMTVHGDVETGGVVKVEGTVNGHVSASQQVLVAKGGEIDGDVDTREAIVGGTVCGAVRALERVEIQAGATVQGDITTKRIAVAEGAVLNGSIKMGDVAESSKAGPQRPVAQPTLPRPSSPIARVAVPPRVTANP